MPGLYSARRHREELSSLSEEYETRLKELQAALTELKEENRRLSAEISLLRAQKQSISDAIIAAGEKREEMQRELDAFSASQKALAVQAAEKAQRLLEDVRAAYPDEETSARFSRTERTERNRPLKNRPPRKARRPYIRNSLFLPRNPRRTRAAAGI